MRVSKSPDSPRRSPRLNALKSALSPVELNDTPLLPPPKTPTRKSPGKKHARKLSHESPLRRSPRLVAKEKLEHSSALGSNFVLPPEASPSMLQSSPFARDQQLENATFDMSPQANPPGATEDTPRPYAPVDTQMVLDGFSSTSVTPQRPESAENSLLDDPVPQLSPTKRTFAEVNTPDLTMMSPVPAERRPIATPVRHILSSKHLGPTKLSGASQPHAEHSGASAPSSELDINATNSSPPPRLPSFARPTRASIAHSQRPTSPCSHESPAKMMRLSQIPSLDPTASPTRSPAKQPTSPRHQAALTGRSPSPRHAFRTPNRSPHRPISSSLTRSLSPVRSARKPRLGSASTDIEALLDRLGMSLDPNSLKELDMRLRSSETKYAGDIVDLQRRCDTIIEDLKAADTTAQVSPDIELALRSYIRTVENDVTKEVLQSELLAAKDYLQRQTSLLSQTKNQFMKHQTLTTRERNLRARIDEYSKLIQDRPVTATKLSDVKAEVEKKSVQLSNIQDEVLKKTLLVETTSKECQKVAGDLVSEQSIQNEKEAEALAKLQLARTQVKTLVSEFKMRGISWSPAGFVLHHRFLDILYDRKTKQQKFQLRSENPVFDHFYKLLDKSDSIRSNLERWGNALKIYHLLNDVRALGFNSWQHRGSTLVLKQRVPQGSVEIILDRGMVLIDSKLRNPSTEENLTDLEGLVAYLKSQPS